MPLYDELWNTPGRLAIPGGSALNSARAMNFMLKNQGHPNYVTYFGSIAKDEKGETLEQVLEAEGVHGNFHYSTEAQTGTCAVIVHNKERTLVANLAAACKYDIEHLHNNLNVLKEAAYIYSTSFFITSNPAALHEVGQFASDNNIPFGYNLSAVFLLQFELENVKKALRHADFLFCNELEAAAYAQANNLGVEAHKDIAIAIAKTEKSNLARPRTVIITDGARPITVVTHLPGTEQIDYQEFPVEPIEKDLIVDTNGAGDSFVGGFFAQMAQGKDLESCVRGGIYLSRECVQRSGCTFPDTFEFN